MKLSIRNWSIIQSIVLAPTIERNESMCVVGKTSWVDPIKTLRNGTLLKDKKVAKKVKKWLSLFYLENDWLYKQSFSMPLLMCLNEEEVNYMLRELHGRICGSHALRASLVLKALRNCYFWLSMKVDTPDLVKKCDKCQRHAHVLKKPQPSSYHYRWHVPFTSGVSIFLDHSLQPQVNWNTLLLPWSTLQNG